MYIDTIQRLATSEGKGQRRGVYCIVGDPNPLHRAAALLHLILQFCLALASSPLQQDVSQVIRHDALPRICVIVDDYRTRGSQASAFTVHSRVAGQNQPVVLHTPTCMREREARLLLVNVAGHGSPYDLPVSRAIDVLAKRKNSPSRDMSQAHETGQYSPSG